MKFSLIQSSLNWLAPYENLAMFEHWFKALPRDSQIVVLPEMFSTGFYMQLEPSQLLPAEEIIGWMRDHAAQLNACLVGSVAINDNDALYNRLYWVMPDGRTFSYDKRHLFRMAGEDRFFKGGKSRLIVEVEGLRCMPLVCYDLRFPVWSRNDLNYDVLLYVANWPQQRIAQWLRLLPARAIENQCFTIGLNRTGSDGNEVDYNGHSGGWDYLGNPLFASHDQEAIIHIDLQVEQLRQFRENFPAWKDRDDFTIHI